MPAGRVPPEVREDIAAAQAQSEVNVAIARAEGEHSVAMERCEALEGAEQLSCKDQADDALDAAKDAARGIEPPPQSQ